MRIGIIGAGFTGLAAAHRLTQRGHHITVLEKEENPGGLAIGYTQKEWDWSLEHHYHHWFTNDFFALDLAEQIGHEVIITKPHTNVFIKGHIYELDSISAFLKFPLLTLLERIRHLFILGIFFKLNPFWQPLEKIHATFLPILIGKQAFTIIWKPQLQNKLGKYLADVSLVWFWARIYKRTPKLAYPKKGFLDFASHLAETLKKKNVAFHFNTEIKFIEQKGSHVVVKTEKITYTFDKVIVTLPSFLFMKLIPNLPENYKKTLSPLKGLGAINLVIRLKKPFFKDKTYWLSVCDTTSKIMAIIEHTNFMDKKNYNNEHIIYVGNYLEKEHSYFSLSKEELLEEYDPFLKKLNPEYRKNIINFDVFKVPFAQPIIPINYSRLKPAMTTPFSRIFLANIEQVYPWDRGTNYAIELGYKVSEIIDEK